MSYDQMSFAGKLTGAKKSAITGARIDLIDSKTKKIVASTISGDGGQYVLNLFRQDAPREFDFLVGRKLSLEVRDSSKQPLVKKKGLVCGPGKVCMTDIKIGSAAEKRFKPEITQLERISGSMLDKSAISMIDTAIASIFPRESSANYRYSRAALCPGPDIDVFDSLLDDAWGSIDGDPVAQRRFRQTLDMIGRRIPANRGGQLPAKGLELLKKAEIDPITFDLPLNRNKDNGAPGEFKIFASATTSAFIPNPEGPDRGRPCLLPPSRLLPPFVAAAGISRNFNDAAYLLGTLQEGLCGIGELGRLMDAAAEGFNGDNFTRLKGMLGFLAGECGPDDGPLPPLPEPGPDPGCPDRPQPPDLFPDPCEEERMDCLMQIAAAISRLRGSGITYNISLITTNDACPGSLIVITGSNFGNVPGQVCFPFGSSSSTPGGTCVTAQSWNDTEIRVIVPAGAGSGDIYLKIIEGHVSVCGKIFAITRRGGGSSLFLGGRASISSLRVNGRITDVWVEPGQDAEISWIASMGGAGTTVRIRMTEGSTTIFDQTGLPDQGSINWSAPDDGREHSYRIHCTASHSCGNASKTLDFVVTIESLLTIQGMEVTQATQFYQSNQHLPNGTYGTDNAVPLIENKRTLVRVYLDSGFGGFDLGDGQGVVSGVMGVLHAKRNGLTLAGSPVLSISAMSARRNDPYLDTRGNIDRTLNFELPGAWRNGDVELRVEVDPDNHLPRRHSGSVEQTVNISFVPARTLKLVGVMIRYTGWQSVGGTKSRVNRPAPAFSSLTTAANWLKRTYPVRDIDFFSAPGNETITFAGDLTIGSGGGCGTQWGNLMEDLRDLADDYSGDDDAVWVGVLPTGWSGAAWGGCGGGTNNAIGVAVIFANDTGPVLAQEAGHGYGRGHAPGCGAGSPDANYPAYGKTSTASIGEFGVDWPAPGTSNWIIRDPDASPGARNDFMSYCGSDWVSPYTYQALFNGGISPSSSLPAGAHHHGGNAHTRINEEADMLILKGKIWKSGQANLRPSFHFTRSTKAPLGEDTGYFVELQDEKRRSIDIHHIIVQDYERETAAVFHFSVAMLITPDTRRLLIRRGDETLLERQVNERSPEIKKLSLEASGGKAEKLKVSLEINSPDSKTWQKLRYSHDNGKSWFPLIGLSERTAMEVDLSKLPGGNRCVIEAYSSDGILTGRARSKPFKVKRKNPKAVISIENGETKVKGGAVRLIGAGMDDAGHPVPKENLSWVSDKDGKLGTGNLIEAKLSEGRHKITLTVKDKAGLTGKESMKIQVS